MEQLTKTFDNYIGKKITQEQLDAVQKEGFMEFSREAIPGGHRVTFAKMKAGLIGKKKVRVFLIDKLPSEESLDAPVEFPNQENVTLITHGAQGEKYVGTYGLANGRKFFCIGESKSKPKAEPKSEPKSDESDDAVPTAATETKPVGKKR